MARSPRRRSRKSKRSGLAGAYRTLLSGAAVGAVWKACLLGALVLLAITAAYMIGRDEGERRAGGPGEIRTARSVDQPRPADRIPREASRPAAPQPVAPPRTAGPALPDGPEPAGPEKPAVTQPPKPADGPAWQKYAVAAKDPGNRPMIALVFDDLGVNRAQTKKTIELRAPLTLSFLTYADDLAQQTAAARAAGHELLVHVPMEPLEIRVTPGPEALMHGLTDAELNRRIGWALTRFDGYVGINNHMGSRFTQDAHGMSAVMAQLKTRGLLFLDSLTIPDSVGSSVASRFGVPHVARDVFLDHFQDREHVRASLEKLEHRARAKGYAVGIGHPHEETLDVVRTWLSTAEARGFAVVPLSAIVRHAQEGVRAQAAVHRADAPLVR